MLEQYSRPIFARQQARFPAIVAKLEAFTRDPDPRKTAVLTLAAILAHDLRNELTIIGVVLEIDGLREPERVGCTVLPG